MRLPQGSSRLTAGRARSRLATTFLLAASTVRCSTDLPKEDVVPARPPGAEAGAPDTDAGELTDGGLPGDGPSTQRYQTKDSGFYSVDYCTRTGRFGSCEPPTIDAPSLDEGDDAVLVRSFRRELPIAPPCTPRAPFPLKTGLVSWWRAEGNGFDVITCQEAQVHSSVEYIPGVEGLAYGITKDAEGVVVPFSNNFDFAPDDEFSLTFWFRPDRLERPGDGTSQAIIARGHWAWDWGVWMQRQNALLSTGAADNNLYGLTLEVEESQWQYVALTYDDGHFRLFLNGTEETLHSSSATITQSEAPLVFGYRDAPGTGYRGGIDEVQLYSRALTQAEVVTSYASWEAQRD